MAAAFEKGPLRWLLTLTPGQRRRPGEITRLIASGLRAGSSLEKLGLDVAEALGEVIDPPASLDAQVTVLGHVMASANAARLLVRSGHVRAAESQLRAIIEGMALIQCLHQNDAQATQWRNAKTVAERRKFEYAQLKKCSQAARDLQSVWDSLNEYVHANAIALPAHSRRRSVFGYDIPVGPLFDSVPMSITLALINSIEYLGIEWVLDNLVSGPATRLRRRLARIGGRITSTSDAMKAAAGHLHVSVTDGIDRADQRRAVAHMSRRARRAGRRDVARWILARAKREA